MVVYVADPVYTESLAGATGKYQINTGIARRLGQYRRPEENVRRGNTVLRRRVRIVIGHLFGQSPTRAIVKTIIDVVLTRPRSGIGAHIRKAGAEGDMQFALVWQAFINDRRHAAGHRPVQIYIVIRRIFVDRRSRRAPHRGGRSLVPARVRADRIVVGVFIKKDGLKGGVAKLVDRVDLVGRTLFVDHHGREEEMRSFLNRRRSGFVGEVVDTSPVGVLVPARAANHLPRISQQRLMLDSVPRVIEIGNM